MNDQVKDIDESAAKAEAAGTGAGRGRARRGRGARAAGGARAGAAGQGRRRSGGGLRARVLESLKTLKDDDTPIEGTDVGQNQLEKLIGMLDKMEGGERGEKMKGKVMELLSPVETDEGFMFSTEGVEKLVAYLEEPPAERPAAAGAARGRLAGGRAGAGRAGARARRPRAGGGAARVGAGRGRRARRLR